MYFLYIIFFIQLRASCGQDSDEMYFENLTCIPVQAQKTKQAQDTISYIMMARFNRTNKNRESYEPENETMFYNCTNIEECLPIQYASITDFTDSTLLLKSCYTKNQTCEFIRFNNLSHSDEVLFFKKTIKFKNFYHINCSFSLNGTYVCYTDDGVAYDIMVNKTNPSPRSGQHEFICEESEMARLTVGASAGAPLDAKRRFIKLNHMDARRTEFLNPCDYMENPDVDCYKPVCVLYNKVYFNCDIGMKFQKVRGGKYVLILGDGRWFREPPKGQIWGVEFPPKIEYTTTTTTSVTTTTTTTESPPWWPPSAHHKYYSGDRVLLKIKGWVVKSSICQYSAHCEP
ncbi:hypothetical protein PYW08_010819 [Mythimna loreyi]|uniref:Uncharacterized protein n=1 Tax=Mythimna loreyi TaxID=667449 RepID=A0ACC2Q1V0_9NEOP|nr:hypothetical protein PYW08_016941 [Mythimna loreyi]KAJ8706193.1 hypothetical protein PYW08_010819 [Mythimna loreyi]